MNFVINFIFPRKGVNKKWTQFFFKVKTLREAFQNKLVKDLETNQREIINLQGKPSTTTKTVKVWTLREAIQQQKTVKVFFKVKTLREAFQNKLVKVWKKIVKVWTLREAFKQNCESLVT